MSEEKREVKHLISLLRLRGDIDPKEIKREQICISPQGFDELHITLERKTIRYCSIELIELLAEFVIKTSSTHNHIANDL